MSNDLPRNYLLSSCAPQVFPGLAAFWHFKESGEAFLAAHGEAYVLAS